MPSRSMRPPRCGGPGSAPSRCRSSRSRMCGPRSARSGRPRAPRKRRAGSSIKSMGSSRPRRRAHPVARGRACCSRWTASSARSGASLGRARARTSTSSSGAPAATTCSPTPGCGSCGSRPRKSVARRPEVILDAVHAPEAARAREDWHALPTVPAVKQPPGPRARGPGVRDPRTAARRDAAPPHGVAPPGSTVPLILLDSPRGRS